MTKVSYMRVADTIPEFEAALHTFMNLWRGANATDAPTHLRVDTVLDQTTQHTLVKVEGERKEEV